MKILCALSEDFRSDNTVRFACNLAQATKAELVCLYVTQEKGDGPSRDADLENVRKKLTGSACDFKSLSGAPVKTILKETRKGEYDLVVLGARMRMTFVEQILGSVPQLVLAKAPSSVLVVRGQGTEVKRILICTGGKAYAEPAIETGISLARSLQAKVTLLHVTIALPSMYTGLDGMEEQLSEFLQTDTPEARHLRWACKRIEEAKVDGELLLRRGAVTDEILREAVMGEHDLMILGAPLPKRPLAEYFLGDVTKLVLSRAEIPLMVVRQPSPAQS